MALRPRGRHLLAGVVLAVALYFAVWGGEFSAFDLARVKRQRQAAQDSAAAFRRQADSLKAEAGKLESDPATIERVARERFGMLRDGETLYRFVPGDTGRARPQAGSRP
ncbi:MAG TPA: septum formation initiator family protein [Longimicrobiaceae bacterium]